MTIQEMVGKLNSLMAKGVSPEAKVKAWDADSELFEEVSCCVYDKHVVELYTDDLS